MARKPVDRGGDRRQEIWTAIRGFGKAEFTLSECFEACRGADRTTVRDYLNSLAAAGILSRMESDIRWTAPQWRVIDRIEEKILRIAGGVE